ncbi:MAG: methyltransferase domain-containing protein [Ruminococcaceae bacterium]|nr:methyltransferase domain-containing protein [Oscillospiraceae bacterium]
MKSWNKRYLNFLSDEWDIAMQLTENFSAEIRTEREIRAHQDENVDRFKKGVGASEQRVRDSFTALEKRGYLKPGMTVLDIGAGVGSYTIPLAERGLFVTSLDVSPIMQDVVRNHKIEKNLDNIDFVLTDWQDVSSADSRRKRYIFSV